MESNFKGYRDRGFKPINTLNSADSPNFSTIAPALAGTKMVHEREPPRIASAPLQTQPQKPTEAILPPVRRTVEPKFGTASPLRNPLQSSSKSVFNVPRPGYVRPEHHRTTPPAADRTQIVKGGYNVAPQPNVNGRPTSTSEIVEIRSSPPVVGQTFPGIPGRSQTAGRLTNPSFKHPTLINGNNASPEVIEIHRPLNFAPKSTYPASRPLYPSSTQSGFKAVNAFKGPQLPRIDLMKNDDDDEDGFNPDKALGDDKFGAFDPNNYMDAAQASENIKALLEGAFDDEDDKPKTRLRKKKQDAAAAVALTEKMQALNVDSAAKNDPQNEVDEEDEDDGSVEGLTVKLLPHQIDGLAWMMDKEIGERKKNGVLPKGGILADDMGLGKTIQALSLILSNPRPTAEELAQMPKRKIPQDVCKATLVVAPLALIKQWEAEIKSKVDRFPKMKVLVHHGTTRSKSYEDLKKFDVVITTYQTLTSEHAGSSEGDQGLKVGCMGVPWYRVILDEAHSIKNRNAKMTQAAYALRSVYRWCLTGTPLQNNLDELQSLIRFLRIKPYSDVKNWRDQISQPMKNGRGGLAMKRLQYFLKAFMKRRTKEVLKKEGGLNFGKGTHANGEAKNGGFKIVGRKIETIVAEFDDSERVLYDRLAARTEKSLGDMMGSSKNDYIGALVLLLRLRQTCNHPELIRGNLRKEKDAMGIESQGAGGFQTPRKTSTSNSGEVDDIVDMFGSLTVETKKCDVCQTKLHKGEVAEGAIRCAECEEALNGYRRRSGQQKQNGKSKKENTAPKDQQRHMHSRRVVDSDDEDEGDWIVPKSEQQLVDLGKAGGSDDEDAEGGGEWLNSNDSDTDDESHVKREKFKRKTRASTATRSELEDDNGESHGTEKNEDDDEEEYNSSNGTTKGLTSSTKIRRLVQILHKESADHKFIVFSEFTSMLDLVEPFLRKEGFRFTRYDGSMKNDDREASLERLRNDPRTRILLCSLRCGSLGLNLTAASRVVILEPFWNPFVEEQAIDRVHRLNQTRDVVVYRLTIANSVEERILDLQEKKRELAKAAIEGGGKAVGKLDMKDILSLFRRDAEHDAKHEDGVDGLALGGGRSAGLLERGPSALVSGVASSRSPVKAAASVAALGSRAAGGAVRREQPKFKVPQSLQADWDANNPYGRRAGFMS